MLSNAPLILINPFCPEFSKRERLNEIIEYSTKGYNYIELTTVEEVEAADLTNRRILFTISLGESGINLNWMAMMKYFRINTNSLEGSIGGVILDGSSEIFTKSAGRDLVFTANRAGCTFPGKPLVEGTKTLKNYYIQAKNLDTDNFKAYMNAGRTLVENIMTYQLPEIKKPKLLAIHASDRKTSNSIALWDMISRDLQDFDIKEISLRNGSVMDCRGCRYETCRHFGEESKCFYGGPIEEQVYPAILECDAVVMVCPNYNDAIGGNLTAFVNRLTALFTTHRFYDKSVFAVIVSGYSGGDIVAQQIISGLNMNKTFALPGKFAIMETANDPRAILESEGVSERAGNFARNLRSRLTGEER
ncbi:MAG: NAD(P)H-dependent oxidoreductase [Eubacterium sp.]|nr:NAD(P)H-dependent oxidoreductase [Candidatus Colimonas fimequi]